VTRTDADLLAIARQDPAAFREFYDRYAAWVHSWFSRQTGSDTAALDLTAETFAQAWLGLRRFRPRRDDDGARWLHGIAQNIARQYYRKQRVERKGRERLGITAETTFVDEGQVIPFFMLPALGGGSTLRGFSSWRFRDRHSLLLSAEWRVLVNRFLDTAVFYDAGKVTSHTSDLDLTDLKTDYGFGFRFHGPIATPLRIEFAKSNEGLQLVFSAKAPF